MDEGQQSIASVVQSIMEMLSDAVNQLILLVIALQEQNSVMPAHIPPAAEAVAGAATALTDIARGLAKDEYEDYEDIHDEIIQVSDEMDASGAGLIKAVHAINKMSDRKAGWEGLLQACRVISGKTIRILEIVYGAEIKRLLFIAEQTRSLIGKTHVEQAESEPDIFAGHVGDLASKAQVLGTRIYWCSLLQTGIDALIYIKNSAMDEESPLLRQELANRGDSLVDQSAHLIAKANELLASPDDPLLRKQFADEVKSLEHQIQHATAPMKDKLQEIKQRSNPEDLLPNKPAQKPAQKTAPQPPQHPAQYNISPKADSGISASNSSAPSAGERGQTTGSHTGALSAIVGENNAVAEVMKAAIMKDPRAVSQSALVLNAGTNRLADVLGELLHNPSTKGSALEAINSIKEHEKGCSTAANELSRNPGSAEARGKLNAALAKLDGGVDIIAAKFANPSESLEIAARKELNVLDVLGVASKHAVPDAVVDAIKSLVQTQQILVPLANNEIATLPPVEPRAIEIKEAVVALSQLLPHQVKLAKDLLEDSSPSKQSEHDDVGAAIRDALYSILGESPARGAAGDLTALIDAEKKLGDKLAVAAGKGDLKGVELALKDINQVHGPMRSKARNAAVKSHDPNQQQKVSDALRDLDALIPQQADMAKEFASRPRDPAKKSKLEAINRDIDKDLATIANALATIDNTPGTDDVFKLIAKEKQDTVNFARSFGNNKPSLALKDAEKAAGAIKDDHPRLVEKATAAAKASADPNVHKVVQKALDELAQLLPKQESEAKELLRSPNPRAKNGLDAATSKIGKTLDDIASALGGRPHGSSASPAKDVSAQAKKAKELNSRLEGLAAKGDAKGVELALKDINNAYTPIATANTAGSSPALRDLDGLFPQQASAAIEFAAKPRDPAKRSKLEGINAKINEKLDDIINDSGSPVQLAGAEDPTPLARRTQKEKELGDRLLETAAKGDSSGVATALRDLKDTHGPLKAKANAIAARIQNPDKRAKIAAALRDLDELLPQQSTSAVALASKPTDQARKGALEDINKKINKDLDDLEGLLSPELAPTENDDLGKLLAIEAEAVNKLADAAFNPSVPQAITGVEQALKDINSTHPKLAAKANAVAKAGSPHIQREVQQHLDQLAKLLPAQEEAAKALPHIKPSDLAPRQSELAVINDKIHDALDGIANAFNGKKPPLSRSSPHVAAEAAAEAARGTKKSKELAGQAVNAAKKGDLKATEHALKDLKDVNSTLPRKLRSAVGKHPDSAKQQNGFVALRHVEPLITELEEAAKDLSRNFRDPAKKSKAEDVLNQLNKDLDVIASIVEPLAQYSPTAATDIGDVRKQAQKQQALGNKLSVAARKGDVPAVEQALKDIHHSYEPLSRKTRNAAESLQNPTKKQQVLKALADIGSALPKQDAAAKDYAKNPKNVAKKALLEAVNKQVDELLDNLANTIGDADKTGRPLVDALIQQVRDHVVEAARAAKMNKPQEATRASKEAQGVFPELLAGVQGTSSSIPPKAQEALDNVAQQLSKQEEAVTAMLGKPKDSAKTAALDNVTKQLADNLEALGDCLAEQNIQNEAQGVKDSLAQLSEAIGANDPHASAVVASLNDKPAAMLSAARKAAQATRDPARKQQGSFRAIAGAEKVLPIIMESVQTALKDPGDAGAKSSTKKALDSIDKLIDEISKITKASPEVESIASANRAADALAALVQAAANGDVVGVEKAAERLLDLKPRLVRTTREAADSLADPNRRRKLFGAIDNVDDTFPAVIAAARELAANPNNGVALEKLKDAQDGAAKVLKNIIEDSGLEALAEAKKLGDDLDLLDAMVAIEDPEAVVDVVRDIAHRQPKFLVAARAQADSVEHELARQNMQQPLSRLSRMLPELLSDAHAVVKSPSGEQPRRKLAKSVAEAKRDIGAAAIAVKTSPPVSVTPSHEQEGIAAAAKVGDLIPELQAAVEAARDRPNDEAAQKRLASVVDNISQPLEAAIANSETGDLTLAEKAAASANNAIDSAKVLVKASLAGDAAAVAVAAKDLAGKHKEFAAKANAAVAKMRNPDRRQQANDVIHGLDVLLPQLEAAAKDAAQNPKDQKAKKKLHNIARVLNDDFKLAKDTLKRPRAAKQANAPDKATKRLNIVIGKGSLPDENSEAVRRLRRSGRELDELAKDSPIDFLKGRKFGEAIADLEKRLSDKNQPDANPANRKQSPASNSSAFSGAKKAIEDAIDALKQKKHCGLHGSIHQAEAGIKLLASAAQQQEPQRVVASMKALAAKQNKVIESAKAARDRMQDMPRKDAIADCIKRMEQVLPAQVSATKEVLQNPGDESLDKLSAVSSEAEAALAELAEAADPSVAAAIVALARKEQAELPKLLSAAKKGDLKGTREVLKNVQAFNDRLVERAMDDGLAKGESDPAKLDELKAASQNLSDVLSLLPLVAQNAANNKDSELEQDKLANLTKELYEPISRVVEIATRDSQPDTKHEAQKQARVILATMKTRGGSKINPNHLIKASQTLAGLMADLVGQTKIEAYKEKERGGLNDRAKAALDLDSVLSEMEASAKISANKQHQAKPAAIQSLEAVLASLTAAASAAPERLPPIKKAATSRPSPQPTPHRLSTSNSNTQATNLAESISLVVRDIQSRANDNDTLSVVSRDLAAELQRFAKADQERRRQDMLISGRAISSHILRLTAEIKTLASQCRDVVLQDKLIRHAQALRNFSVQLKILAAVKAASNDDSANNAQLASMTQALGNVLTDVSITVTILKKSKKI